MPEGNTWTPVVLTLSIAYLLYRKWLDDDEDGDDSAPPGEMYN